MKAIQLTKFGNAELAFQQIEISLPEVHANQVLIKVHAFGLNYADVMARKGLYKDAPPLPAVLGYEVVGIIEKIGKNVTNFEVGQRVLAFTRFGGYAEYAVADYRAVIAINDSVLNGEAVALATQYCTAYFAAMMMANIQPGEKVLVHAAAGGVGTAVIQLAKQIGCEIYATVGSDAKFSYLNELGVDFPINYVNNDFAEIIRSKGIQMDVIFDPVGGSSFKKGKTILAHGGRIVCYGGAERSSGNLLQTLKFVFNFGFFSPIALLMKSQGYIGVNMLRIADNKPEMIQHCLKNVMKLFDEGKLSPKVGASFKSSEIVLAHQLLESRKSVGKIVVEW
jgi:NADPH:quinone reductase-like Zn-dependent oxidoreductase